jgi:hypothetical protein
VRLSKLEEECLSKDLAQSRQHWYLEFCELNIGRAQLKQGSSELWTREFVNALLIQNLADSLEE